MVLKCKSAMEKIIQYLNTHLDAYKKERDAVAEGIYSSGNPVEYYDGIISAFGSIFNYIQQVGDVKTLAEINKKIRESPGYAAFGITHQ